MLLCVILASLAATAGVFSYEVTFKNVTVLADSQSAFIRTSNTLRAYVQEKTVQNISFQENDLIPALYVNAITDLNHLRVLDLSHHGVEVIQRGAFKNLPQLENLYLDGNKITEIAHGVFNNLYSLTCLSLRANEIETVAERAFNNLNNLNFLLLARNKLKSFDPIWLKDKPFLFVVELNENSIEEIPDGAFESFDQEIFLGDNKIQNISREMFGEGKKLRVLSLHDNEIETWDEEVFDDIEIITFDVTFNKINCLQGNLTELFVADYNLIKGNPWNCSCLEKIARDTLKENSHVYVDWAPAAEDCNLLL